MCVVSRQEDGDEACVNGGSGSNRASKPRRSFRLIFLEHESEKTYHRRDDAGLEPAVHERVAELLVREEVEDRVAQRDVEVVQDRELDVYIYI